MNALKLSLQFNNDHKLASLKCFSSATDVECLPNELSKATISCLVKEIFSSGDPNRTFNAVPIPVKTKINAFHFNAINDVLMFKYLAIIIQT